MAEGQPPALYRRSSQLVVCFCVTEDLIKTATKSVLQKTPTQANISPALFSIFTSPQQTALVYSQGYQYSHLNAKYITQNILQVTQTRVDSHSHWSMSSGKMLIHGSVALIPVCPVYSGTFCIGPGAPGAVDPCFKLHNPQQQEDGLTGLLLYLLLQINITLQTKSGSCSRSAVLSQLALSQIHFAMLNATEKQGAQFRMLAVPVLHSCTLGLQDQLNLPGAARDTNSNTEQPSTVTAYAFLTSLFMEQHSKLDKTIKRCPSSFQNIVTTLL